MHDDANFESRLMAFVREGSDPDLAHHISSCPECQEQVETLRHLARFQDTTGGTLQRTPDPVDHALVSLFATVRPDLVRTPAPSPLSRIAERLRIITAELFHDTAASPQLAGLRGDGPQKTRHLAFMSQVADLDLEVTPQDDEWSVAGQIGMDDVPSNLIIRFMPANLDPAESDAPGIVTAPVSESGYFTLSLETGEWSAAVDLDDATVVFPGVRL